MLTADLPFDRSNDQPEAQLEGKDKAGCWTTLRLTNVQAAACPMDREVAPQLITSDEVDMAGKDDSDPTRGGDEVSIPEEIHPL